jgi:hypothetical protein
MAGWFAFAKLEDGAGELGARAETGEKRRPYSALTGSN